MARGARLVKAIKSKVRVTLIQGRTWNTGTNKEEKRPRRILGNTYPKRNLRKETCNKQTYRNRKWDMRNTGSWNSRWKKTKANAGRV